MRVWRDVAPRFDVAASTHGPPPPTAMPTASPPVFMGELAARARIFEFSNCKTWYSSTKTSEFVALSHAKNSLIFVPGLAVRELKSLT